MKFTNNRKKAVNLSGKSSGRYNWENASVVFEKELRNGSKSVAVNAPDSGEMKSAIV